MIRYKFHFEMNRTPSGDLIEYTQCVWPNCKNIYCLDPILKWYDKRWDEVCVREINALPWVDSV